MYRLLDKKTPINKVIYSDLADDDVIQHITRGGQVGWIVEDNFIVIDIDNSEYAQIVYNIVNYEKIKCKINKTSKGLHFIFKTQKLFKQGVNLHTPIGVTIDTRVAQQGFIVLPINDENREEINSDLKLEDVDSLPKWLEPLAINPKNEGFIPHIGATEGGRNDALNTHLFRLRGQGVSAKTTVKTLNLINRFVFKDPLSPEEMAVILREDRLDLELFAQNSKFDHVAIAHKLQENHTIVYMYDTFYVYENGVYIPYRRELERFMLVLKPDIKKSQREEVLHTLALMCETSEADINEELVVVRNGIFNLKTEQLEPHTPNRISINKMEFNFKPNLASPEIEDYLSGISNNTPERVQLLKQMIGYMLTCTTREQVMFFLHGRSARNGKSVFQQLIKHLIGDANVSNISLDKLSKASNNFLLPELAGKVANINADISSKYLEEVSDIKQIVSSDEMTGARKYGQPFTFKPYCKLMFSANNMPKTAKDEGFARRLIIIPFTKQFKEDSDFNIKRLMSQDNMDYLGTICILEYAKLFKKNPNDLSKWGDFETIVKQKREYYNEDFYINSFLLDEIDEIYKKSRMKTKYYVISKTHLYEMYTFWSHTNKIKVLSRPSFNRDLKMFFKEARSDGQHVWALPKNIQDVKDKLEYEEVEEIDDMEETEEIKEDVEND